MALLPPRGADPVARDRFWHRATLVFLVVTSLARLCLLPLIELSADEAYYWDWSRRLSLGYYDQGPLIAYLIRATTTLFGTTEFGVRFGVWACLVGTLVCVYMLVRRFASPLAGFLTVVLLSLTPLVAVGSIVATYDPPLVLFWTLTLAALERALFARDAKAQRWGWLWAGIATGLGLLSKHTMLLIVPCVLLFLALSPRHRRWLRDPLPYLSFALTLLMYSGVIWWNAGHHWWTFGHLLFLAGKSRGNPLGRFAELVGGQALLLGPGLFLGSLWALRRRKWEGTPAGADHTDPSGCDAFAPRTAANEEDRESGRPTATELLLYLRCFGLPVIAFFCLMTLKARVQANWAPCAWITPAMALGMALASSLERRGGAARRTLPRAARQAWVIALTGAALMLLTMSPWLRLKLGLRQKPEDDIGNRTYGARQMAAEADAARREMERSGRPVVVIGNDYQNASLLGFYLPDHPLTYELFLQVRMSNYSAHLDELKAWLGRDALFVTDNPNDDAFLRQLFERVEWSKPYPVWRRPYFTEPIRVHYYVRCYNLRKLVGLKYANGG